MQIDAVQNSIHNEGIVEQKKCPHCYTYMDTKAKICPNCKKKVGKREKNSVAAKHHSAGSLLCVIVTLLFVLVIIMGAVYK